MKQSIQDELFRDLLEEIRTHPKIELRDMIKFLYQGILGVEHLLGDPETVREKVDAEMKTLEPDDTEPLITPAGPLFMRLHLRPAMARGYSPETIAGMMLATEPSEYDRMDVLRACYAFSENRMPLQRMFTFRNHADSMHIPNLVFSHTDQYKAEYAPAYRIVSRKFEPLLESILRIQQCLEASDTGRCIVTLDGPCATGKSTVANLLSNVFHATLVHTDEYVVPHARKTEERLRVPGGNCEWERLTEEVIIPFKEGRTCCIRPYDCHADIMLEANLVEPKGIMIVEGSYVNLPQIRRWTDLSLFAEASYETRMSRLQERESEASLEMFKSRWIPLENAYFENYGLPDDKCLIIRTE